MPDDSSPLPWTPQQWADLRAVAQESARKSRVASTFLPLVGPLPKDQATVPSNWMTVFDRKDPLLPGEAERRLEVRSGKTLHLLTASCNIYLRGSEIADPELSAAKAMVRRAAEVLGRVEDAVVFHGLPKNAKYPTLADGTAVVRPLIYKLTGGSDLTGLLQAADTDFDARSKRDAPADLTNLRAKHDDLAKKQGELGTKRTERAGTAVANAETAVREAEKNADIMCVRVERRAQPPDGSPIVEAVVEAIEKLEARGHFGPFAVVLGHALFREATTPTRSLVLPSDRMVEFLDGRRVQRSGALPADEGVVIALGGEPIELVLARDVDISFLQVTLEPRHVLRIFERFVLRIKELDAVCRVTSTDGFLLTPGFVPRRAGA